ncbi:MAG: glycoside hydrolase TIM-barrel-like domain-containing protein, partial [Pseudomonadota bacterium]
PNCKSVSLIVSWFGDDLRCGRCEIQPCVETGDKETEPGEWRVSGVGRSGARVVSRDGEDRPIYGGTPTDASVIRAIQELNARGFKVMFYPFILMDVPEGNTKPDPWTGETGQPVFPWRGRITLDAAPGTAGSTDKTAAASTEVDAFFGAAAAGDFAPSGETIAYSGPAEWSFRRFILHYANLCAIAGGVHSFCIGSEMRSLTQIRSAQSVYPAVQKLQALAADARAALGPTTQIGYAADWSEYFGHQPNDGSGDVHFHLDPLWAHPQIDFIGIDNYLPLSDWRYEESHADAVAGAKSVYDPAYLDANVEGGEGYDWYYASDADRLAQTRTPIVDGAHGEDWIFRPKDVRNWWASPHYDRPGGVRSSSKTAWTPQSKPIWFTEIGCPAVDLGGNQPNVFVDPKSSENALPRFSRGVRDDFMQQRYLQAALTHWEAPENNPVSPLYGERMVDLNQVFLWTWDSRPWPDYPNRSDVWSDGANHRLGHWLTGRLGGATLSDVVAEICEESGVDGYDVSELHGVVQGYLQTEQRTGRAALQSLMTAFAFDAIESEGMLKFRHRDRPPEASLAVEDIAASREGGADITLSRAPEGELPRAIRFSFIDSERGYETGALEAVASDGRSSRVESASAPILLDSGAAQNIADRYLNEARAGREAIDVVCARRSLALEPGDIVRFDGDGRYRVERIEEDGALSATLTKIEAGAYAEPPRAPELASPPPVYPAAPLAHIYLDLPLIDGDETGPSVAAFADPWGGAAALLSSDDGVTFSDEARIARPSVIGATTSDLVTARPDLWMRGAGVDVQLFGLGLSSSPDISVLNGANRAAVQTPSGAWEIFQFQSAELVGVDIWRLERLLRGQCGSESYIGSVIPAGARFVLLDGAVEQIAGPDALRGVERTWRIGPARKPHTHDSFETFQATDNAARLRPYAPAHFRAKRDAITGDVLLTWIRRTRVFGESWEGVEPPLAESREAYALRIGDVRSVETTSPSYVYSAALQAADGVSGALEIAVSQISDQYGPGPESKVIVDV